MGLRIVGVVYGDWYIAVLHRATAAPNVMRIAKLKENI
jgi:hypothetical protein